MIFYPLYHKRTSVINPSAIHKDLPSSQPFFFFLHHGSVSSTPGHGVLFSVFRLRAGQLDDHGAIHLLHVWHYYGFLSTDLRLMVCAGSTSVLSSLLVSSA